MVDNKEFSNVEMEKAKELNKWRVSFDNISLGLIIVDENAVIKEANKIFINMISMGNNEVVNKYFGDAICCEKSFEQGCGKCDNMVNCIMRKSIAEAYRTGEAQKDIRTSFKIKKNQEYIDRYFKINIIPLVEINNSRVLMELQDITERKNVEYALQESNKKFRSLFNNAVDAIFVRSLEEEEEKPSYFTEANDIACKLLGYSRKEFLKMTPIDITLFDQQASLKEKMKSLRNKGKVIYESTFIKKNGEAIPVEIKSNVNMMEGKKVVFSIVRDIRYKKISENLIKSSEEEMKKAMEATKAAYATKSEFLANMSHEIRTPLNGVIGMVDLTLLSDLTLEQRDNLIIAKSCADSLLNIINGILDFSKIEAGKLTIENRSFDLEVLLDKVLKIHYTEANDKELKFSYELPFNLPKNIKGDPGRLQQILNNLLSNAIKFTDLGSIILKLKILKVNSNNISLQFSVKDTGIGIEEKDMNKLFKTFSQVDGSYTRKHGGTGLGLVISKQLIEMMGGEIQVISEKGIGSTFSFSLDFEIILDDLKSNVTASIAKKFKTKRDAHILLVEDDKINQKVISQMLIEMGYSLDIAENGYNALEMIDKEEYDICLMDIQMPCMNGAQTTFHIREKEKLNGKHIPILALTAYALSGDREKFINLGMDGYISKPIQMGKLFELIEAFLNQKNIKTPESILKELISKYDGEKKIDNYSAKEKAEKERYIMNIIYEFKEAIRFKDFNLIENTAHIMKGYASAIGEDKLKIIAFRIELAARRNDLMDIERILKASEEHFIIV